MHGRAIRHPIGYTLARRAFSIPLCLVPGQCLSMAGHRPLPAAPAPLELVEHETHPALVQRRYGKRERSMSTLYRKPLRKR